MRRNRRKKQDNDANDCDDIFLDLPRGVEGRLKKENWLPKQFFEPPDELTLSHQYDSKKGDIFLGMAKSRAFSCERFDGRLESYCVGGIPIGSRDDRHLISVAGSRSGKGRSAIIPNLLTYEGSVFSIDPKGDHARLTAAHRAGFLEQDVCIIDPFGAVPNELHPYLKRFNPLSILNYESPSIVEDSGLVAGALIEHETKDRHWSDTAQAFLEGVILHVVSSIYIPKRDKTLLKVYDLIACRENTLEELLEEMKANDALDGRVAAAALTLEEKGDTERMSVLSTARRNLKFLDYDPIRDCLSENEINFEDLKRKRQTIYVCLPVMRMNTCSGLLRLCVNLALSSMESCNEKGEYPVLMILDEFPVLGYMKELETAIGYVAGLGVKLWVFVQDLSQLKAIYKERWETFIGNAGVIQCFGNSEQTTTEYISKRLGQTTMVVTNENSVTRDQVNNHGATGLSYSTQLNPLLSPEEVSMYFARDDMMCRQLILQPGKRPWVLQRANYDSHEYFNIQKYE